MASISSLMGSSSSTSSIYGSRNTNIISGLASGMDTESMIEGMVQSYQQKIQSLQQDRTKLQWQQEAYQSISNKLVEFSRKYTSYASTTNLFSSSFFNNAVITTAKGTYADRVTASGKSSSDVVLNGVQQLASAARYQTSAQALGASGTAASGGHVDLSQPMALSKMSGSLEITYGTQEITLDFGETEDLSKADGTLDTQKFQEALEKKLSELELKNADGDVVKADTLIGVNVGSDGAVTLTNKGTGGDSVYVSRASGDLSGVLTDMEEDGTFQVKTDVQVADKFTSKADYLSGKTFTVTLNGQTKKITLGDIERQQKDTGGTETWSEATARVLQESLDKAFGKDRVNVELKSTSSNPNYFSFEVGQGDTFSIRSDTTGVGELLFGEGNDGLSSYLDVSKSLSDLGSFDASTGVLTLSNGTKLQGTLMEQVPAGERVLKDGVYYDKDGNKLDAEGYRVNDDGERLYEFSLTINGEEIGSFDQDTALETVLNSINSNLEGGVNVSYSKLTNQFVLTAKETGAAQGIAISEKNADGTGNLAAALFGATADADGNITATGDNGYTGGKDAIFSVSINGGEALTYTRSSNTVDLDGLTVTLEGTFNMDESGKLIDENESVTFTTKTDTDTLVDAIKQMVEDYNTMVTEIKKAYSDMPLQQSNGSRYEPLTADDEADMTESEIAAYEEKAKTGLLFMDQDLSSLYNSLRSAVTSGGTEGSYLRSIGIQTSYDDGLTTINLDESALREALESDLEGVKNAFTKSTEYGSSTNGLMASIQNTIDRYASTTGAVKGILIEKAGSQYAPTKALDNDLLNKMEDIDEEISKWQDKMSDKVDYYTNKFTQLEMLINEMNSQSSALSGLMGG